MFDSVGWGEILVLVVIALFVLGPERLPDSAAWLGKAVRQIREYASGARDQLRRDFGSELDELREPLADLRSLRDLNPRRAVTKYLLDDYDPHEDLRAFDIRSELKRDDERNAGGRARRPTDDKDPAGVHLGEKAHFDGDAT